MGNGVTFSSDDNIQVSQINNKKKIRTNNKIIEVDNAEIIGDGNLICGSNNTIIGKKNIIDGKNNFICQKLDKKFDLIMRNNDINIFRKLNDENFK
jgi:hypothetical protein